MGRGSKRQGDGAEGAPRERSGPMKPSAPSEEQVAAIISCDVDKYDELLAAKVQGPASTAGHATLRKRGL